MVNNSGLNCVCVCVCVVNSSLIALLCHKWNIAAASSPVIKQANGCFRVRLAGLSHGFTDALNENA